MSYTSFKLEVANHIATISFNRPDKANSLDLTAWNEMRQVFEEVAAIPEARVVILRGEGKHFCAGIDLQTLMGVPTSFKGTCEARKRVQIRQFIKNIQDAISAIEQCGKPVIAAIHKACVGGGLNIVTACDMRYCTDDAFFSIKETKLGLVADIGVLQRLPYIINPGFMAELAYTGRQFGGQEAQEMGIVTKSFDTQEAMMVKVRSLATEIAANSPLVVRGVKEMLLYQRDHSVKDGLDYVANYNAGMIISNDIMQAMQANFTKQTPVFED